jgi:hypothetical protein
VRNLPSPGGRRCVIERESRRALPPPRAMRLRAAAAVCLALWGLAACRCVRPGPRFRSEQPRVRVCCALHAPRHGCASGTLRLRGGADTDLRGAPSAAERSREASALGDAEKARALDSLKLMASRLHMVRMVLQEVARSNAGDHRS